MEWVIALIVVMTAPRAGLNRRPFSGLEARLSAHHRAGYEI
jgi:hypothetical protein